MLKLGDRVRILTPTISSEQMDVIDRIQLYNRGKVGTISHIDNGEAFIDAEDVTLSGRNFIVSLYIKLIGLEKV